MTHKNIKHLEVTNLDINSVVAIVEGVALISNIINNILTFVEL